MTLALQMSLNSHNSELSTAFTHTLPCLLCCIWVFYRFYVTPTEVEDPNLIFLTPLVQNRSRLQYNKGS